eukprot:15471116-Alexandrium_andersonii.AAC.1
MAAANQAKATMELTGRVTDLNTDFHALAPTNTQSTRQHLQSGGHFGPPSAGRPDSPPLHTEARGVQTRPTGWAQDGPLVAIG